MKSIRDISLQFKLIFWCVDEVNRDSIDSLLVLMNWLLESIDQPYLLDSIISQLARPEVISRMSTFAKQVRLLSSHFYRLIL